MKRTWHWVAAGVAALGLFAVTAEAQSQRFVRYEQAGQVSLGELVGRTVHQLSDAPYGSTDLHDEAEMVVAVGREASNVSVEDASDYVFGVSAGNDVSERFWQARDIRWCRAKGSGTFNAVGPHLVTGLDYADLDMGVGVLRNEVVQGL